MAEPVCFIQSDFLKLIREKAVHNLSALEIRVEKYVDILNFRLFDDNTNRDAFIFRSFTENPGGLLLPFPIFNSYPFIIKVKGIRADQSRWMKDFENFSHREDFGSSGCYGAVAT